VNHILDEELAMRIDSPIRSYKPMIRFALALGAASLLGACASIPQRAWRNGEAMQYSRAYSRVLNGDMSMEAHRQLESSLNPRRLNYREVAYPAFRPWW
jgi:hypothetical protein